MQFVDKFGNTVECSVDEYVRLVNTAARFNTSTKQVVKKTTERSKKRKRYARIDYDVAAQKIAEKIKKGWKPKSLTDIYNAVRVSQCIETLHRLNDKTKKMYGLDLMKYKNNRGRKQI